MCIHYNGRDPSSCELCLAGGLPPPAPKEILPGTDVIEGVPGGPRIATTEEAKANAAAVELPGAETCAVCGEPLDSDDCVSDGGGTVFASPEHTPPAPKVQPDWYSSANYHTHEERIHRHVGALDAALHTITCACDKIMHCHDAKREAILLHGWRRRFGTLLRACGVVLSIDAKEYQFFRDAIDVLWRQSQEKK